MNSDFIQSLMQTVGYTNGRILSASYSLREKAMSIRKLTKALPVDISVRIAADVIIPLCKELYLNIFEIAILLHIRENPIKFPIIEFDDVRDEIVSHVSNHMFNRNLWNIHFPYVENIADCNFYFDILTNATHEIINSPMWNSIKEYLHDDNIMYSIVQRHCVHIDTEIVCAVMSDLTPDAWALLRSVDVMEDMEGFTTTSICNVIYQYFVKNRITYNFNIWFDQRIELENEKNDFRPNMFWRQFREERCVRGCF